MLHTVADPNRSISVQYRKENAQNLRSGVCGLIGVPAEARTDPTEGFLAKATSVVRLHRIFANLALAPFRRRVSLASLNPGKLSMG